MSGRLQRVLGNNLRVIREQRSLSQEEFAAILDVHRTYMGGVERGERNLTLQSVERIAERLHVDPVSLLHSKPEARQIETVHPNESVNPLGTLANR